jgi:uncharacterized protein (TIGR02449 family)
MEELLQRLERKIKELVERHDHLKNFNHQLTHGKTALAREKDALIMKHQKAINQIQNLVTRLKAIEKLP